MKDSFEKHSIERQAPLPDQDTPADTPEDAPDPDGQRPESDGPTRDKIRAAFHTSVGTIGRLRYQPWSASGHAVRKPEAIVEWKATKRSPLDERRSRRRRNRRARSARKLSRV